MGILENIIAGIFTSYLRDTTPADVLESIQKNKPLLNGDSDVNWARYRRWTRKLPGVQINYPGIVDALAKNRPDLLATICSNPGGVAWLQNQVTPLRVKLGMERPKYVAGP